MHSLITFTNHLDIFLEDPDGKLVLEQVLV